MISDFDRSLGSRYFLNVANERTCFASCASAFKRIQVDLLSLPVVALPNLFPAI